MCIRDSRRGVRESLEVQTMNMAKAAAALIRENVRYPDGRPAEVIIADTTIGGVKEASMCAEKFEREGVDITLTVTPCWCYGTETMDMNPHTIKADVYKRQPMHRHPSRIEHGWRRYRRRLPHMV